jgi:hypothetical protein
MAVTVALAVEEAGEAEEVDASSQEQMIRAVAEVEVAEEVMAAPEAPVEPGEVAHLPFSPLTTVLTDL